MGARESPDQPSRHRHRQHPDTEHRLQGIAIHHRAQWHMRCMFAGRDAAHCREMKHLFIEQYMKDKRLQAGVLYAGDLKAVREKLV